MLTHSWQRDARNPILPPLEPFDCTSCMNPWIVPQGDEYWMFYAGGDSEGNRRICLAIAPKDDIATWRRLGPVLELGAPGAFDEYWCVLPAVVKVGDRWHLYWTGRAHGEGGLQTFAGIGLAVSDDLRQWERYSTEPVLRGDGFPDHPANQGIAGAGSINQLQDGRLRMHYTLAVGTPSASQHIDQRKLSVIAHSRDGILWTDRRIIMRPRSDANYENVAIIGLNVWRDGDLNRAIYAAIGTRFGSYSICEAISADSLFWHRGEPGENLALAPQGDGWESAMVEYPHVVREGDHMRLFYCGNGYGATGIGTATAPLIR